MNSPSTLRTAAAGKVVIAAHDLRKTYQLGDNLAVHALRGLNLEVQRGEYAAIMGPSGSGKSTLLQILGCLDTPTSGSYQLAGEEVADLNELALAVIRNRRIGFIFQAYNLLPRVSALENVALPLLYRGVPARERRQRALAALERVGLGDRTHHRPNELSGGQKQRVAIARALTTDPDILLADEPTGNLDSKTGAAIVRLLEDLNANGTTIVVITHDRDIATQFPRQVSLLDGRVEDDSRARP